jgi:hypothetical protein
LWKKNNWGKEMNLENFKEIYQKIIIENSDEFVTDTL